jgi:hypothetical protein
VTINVQYIHHLSTEENFGGSAAFAARRARFFVFRFFSSFGVYAASRRRRDARFVRRPLAERHLQKRT